MIVSEKELDLAISEVDELTDKLDYLTSEESSRLDLLTNAIEEYEKVHYPMEGDYQ